MIYPRQQYRIYRDFGTTSGNSQNSLFIFCQEVLGYDLADFFQRNAEVIRTEVYGTLQALLSAE